VVVLRRIRAGELLALVGAACVIISTFVPSYEVPTRESLNAWDTFGAGVVLLLLAALGALWLIFSALRERSPALPVVAGVWCVPLGIAAVIAALVRLLERPQHAMSVCAGPWLALAGAVTILAGGWRSIHDERRSLYRPANPEPRPTP
jgi:drug/metabolite transporter (DMT)-like permease